MWVLLTFLWFVQTHTFDLPNDGCGSDLTIDKDHYNTSEVYNIGDAFPTETHYDKFGNLFFIESGRNLDGYFFQAKIIKANSTVPERIEGLPLGQCYSIAVDNKNSMVYFGTGKGIYAYNYDSEDAKLISSPNIKPNELFVDKDGNKYITESPDGIEQMYLLSGEKKIRFKTLEALNEVAVDDKNNFYFIREEKLFVLKSNLSFPILIGNLTYDGLAQISFHKNTVYVASETLLYLHENDTGNLKNVDNVPGNVTAIAFDYASNLVLGTYGKIIKYDNKNTECYHRNNT
ncbi:uncharacterized protein LOC123708664 [Pieris brassicae]|uniref:Ommochrome-binding protein-like n=1 Tax=Pieris brassicae TaxID=7116 RepID=A0A9P0SRH4_PIEBR|nr:uncharacterized protein LOC123708664 [Pieris brassicae]CAH3901178.1 unnamed protein product [Pieris brassicae]